MCLVFNHVHRRFHKFNQVGCFPIQFQTAGFNFRKIEDVVDQAHQMIPRMLKHSAYIAAEYP